MKLIDALQVINKSEWTSFRKYLTAHHREDSDLFHLFLVLTKSKKNLSNDLLTEQIRSKYFWALTQKNYLNLYSKLYQEFEKWIVIYELQQEPIEHDLQLLKALNKRGLYQAATSLQGEIHEKINQKKDFNSLYNKQLFDMYYMQYYSDNPIKYQQADFLEKTIYHFLLFMHHRLTFFEIEMNNWGSIRKIDFSDLQSSVKNIKRFLPVDDIAIEIENLRKLWFDKDVSVLLDITRKIEAKYYGTSGEMLALFLQYTIRNTTLMYNEHLIDDRTILLRLYNFGFEHQLLFNSEKIDVIGFLNTLNNLSTLIDKKDTIAFVEQWHHKVDSQDNEAIYHLSLAQIAFHYQDYSDIIELLKYNLNVSWPNKIRVQALLAIAYYECRSDNYEVMMQHQENFKRQLKRAQSKISPRFYIANKHLLQCIGELIKADHQKITIDEKRYNPIIFRSWVLKKIKQMK